MSFKRLDPEDFLVSSQEVSQTTWSGFQPTLKVMQVNPTQKQSPSGQFYLSVYNGDDTLIGKEVQFDIAYANKDGYGSNPYNTSTNLDKYTPTKTLYGQYRSLLLEDENSEFTFGNTKSKHFFILNINRARYKEKLIPGSFNLTLKSNVNEEYITLTDNSQDVIVPDYYGSQRVYQIVKGIDGSGSSSPNGGYLIPESDKRISYGWLLPDIGVILLNADALKDDPKIALDFNSTTNDTSKDNNQALFDIIYKEGMDLATGVLEEDIKGFTLQSSETISSNYVFIRPRNSEFNYSENPTFMKGTTGEVIHDSSIHNPQVFPTTIGLYNDSNELVAVAKISRPAIKDFTRELLFRLKLDF